MNKRQFAGSVFVICSFAAVAGAQTTVAVAVTSSGVPVAPGQSIFNDMSGDGRFVVFTSNAKLVPEDTNSLDDVYRHDRATGVTARISVGLGGAQANAASTNATISDDGATVAFVSGASNLVANDANAANDVFVWRASGGTIELASVDSNEVQVCCSGSGSPSMSADGRYVVFITPNALDANDLNGFSDIYVRDLILLATERVSVDTSGGDANSGCLIAFQSISDDGRYVVFASTASDLVANDTNGLSFDVFVRDRQLGATERANLDSSGAQIPFPGVEVPFPSISGNGRVVTWQSDVQTIVQPPDVQGHNDVFVRDLDAGTTTKVSVGIGGAEANGDSYVSALSFDGNEIVFSSLAFNIVPGTAPGQHVYVYDRAAGTYRQTDVTTTGQQAQNNQVAKQDQLALSPDGQIVGFSSGATGLVPLNMNPRNVYLNDGTTYSPVMRYCAAKLNSLGCLPLIGASSFTSLTGYDAFWVSALGVRNQKSGLLFWGTTAAAIPFAGGTLCIAPPVVRTTIQSSFGNNLPTNDCSGIYTILFSQAYMASQSISAGQTLYAQYWSRDPGFAPPNNVGLTDAVSFEVVP